MARSQLDSVKRHRYRTPFGMLTYFGPRISFELTSRSRSERAPATKKPKGPVVTIHHRPFFCVPALSRGRAAIRLAASWNGTGDMVSRWPESGALGRQGGVSNSRDAHAAMRYRLDFKCGSVNLDERDRNRWGSGLRSMFRGRVEWFESTTSGKGRKLVKQAWRRLTYGGTASDSTAP